MASETTSRDQPNSSDTGTRKMPELDRNAAAHTRVTKVTPATAQARCRTIT